MRRRPWLVALAAPVLMLAATAGCGSGSSSSGDTTINTSPQKVSGPLQVYAYEDGFTPGYVRSFKAEYPKVQLETQAFQSSTQALTKLRTGAVSPDVINTCVDENAAEEVRLGVFQPLDVSKIPNWKNIDPQLKKLPGVEADGKVYVIPVDAGDGGIQYDPRHVHPAPTSWKDLFNPKYSGWGVDRGQPRDGNRCRRACDRHQGSAPHDGRTAESGQGLPHRAPEPVPHLVGERHRQRAAVQDR